MKVAVTGSSGLVGRQLVASLAKRRDTVIRLVRSGAASAGGDTALWDPAAGLSSPEKLERIDAVVHLAGDNIASGRWTPQKKESIRNSRVQGTQSLVRSLAALTTPPRVLVCASAVGYYGDRGQEVLTEESPVGQGFLADTCKQWEAASAPAVQKGVRVVHLRFGIILSTQEGALAKMLLPFRMGAGGILGNGRQYWSWIDLEDVVGMIEHALTDENLKGPVNAVAPNPATNQDFTRILGKVLSRPTIFPVPAFGARLVFGEMADALLLASCRAVPQRMTKAGYRYRYADLESALRHQLQRS